MVFAPSRQVPSCSVTLDGIDLPVVRTYRYLGVIPTPSLRWTDHVIHLTARGFGLFAQTTTWSRSEDLPVSFGRLLLSTYVLPSTTFGLEFAGESPSTLQHCLSSTDHSAGGVVIHCGGQRALLMRLSSAIWGFSTRPAWLTVKLCPYLAASRRWIQEPVHHSLRQSFARRLVSLALGHIGVVLSWSITHAGSQNPLALDQEALQAHYDVGSHAEWHQHFIALGVSGLCLASLRSTLSALTAHPRTSL